MKYLVIALALLMTGCLEGRKVSQEDVAMADCICQKRLKQGASHVTRYGDRIEFGCEELGSGFVHFDATYTVGCTK